MALFLYVCKGSISTNIFRVWANIDFLQKSFLTSTTRHMVIFDARVERKKEGPSEMSSEHFEF